MIMTLFDDDQILKAYTQDIAKETAIRMLKTGKLSLEEIAEYVPALSIKELKELEAELMQPV